MNDTKQEIDGHGPDRDRLHDTAMSQHGYFTWSQARDSGYSSSLISHHATSGNFWRVRRGVYRFRDVPSFEREAELTAWLAAGREDALLSHDTALELLGLSDVIPARIHVTVPRSRRGYRGDPDMNIHTSSRPLRPDERTTWRGLGTTSAARSIADAADAGLQPDQVARAARMAVDQAMTTPDRLIRQAAEKGERIEGLIRQSLGE